MALTLLSGASFALPVSADVLFDNSAYTTAGTNQNYLSRLDDGCGGGNDLMTEYSFVYATTTQIEITSVYFPTVIGSSTSTTETLTLTLTSGDFLEQDSQFIYPSTTSVTFTFDNPLVSLDGEVLFNFTDAQNLTDLGMNHTISWYGVDAANLSGFTDQTYTYYGSCAGAPFYVNPAIYGNVPVVIYGESEITDLPDGSAIPPTSTYDGTYSELLPTFAWGSSTITGSSTLFSGHLGEMLATSTDRFPMCVIQPWFTFADQVVGAVRASGTQTLVVGGGLYATTTFTLTGADAIFAATGIGGFWVTLLPILEAIAWLAFGAYVLQDLFGTKEQSETL